MAAQQAESPIRYRRVSLSVGYESILFPLDTGELIAALPEQGFILAEAIPTPPLGARLDISGPVARKGDIILRVNTDRNYIGIDGLDPATVVNELDTLERFLDERLHFGSQDMSRYYELLADLIVHANRSPLATIAQVFKASSVIQEMGHVLGSQTANYGVRLVPQSGEPTSPEWFDIRIEPRVQQASEHYLVGVVYRSADRSKVAKFAQGLEETVTQLVRILEK